MLKQLPILLVLLGAATPASHHEAAPLDWLALPEALQQALDEQRPVLVYVHAVWCGPCRRLERETFSDPQVQAHLKRFSKAKLTFDDHDQKHRVGPYRLTEAGWAKRFGAEATPSLVFLDPNGALLARKTGFLSARDLRPILEAALAATSVE